MERARAKHTPFLGNPIHHGHKVLHGCGIHNQKVKPRPSWEQSPPRGDLSQEKTLSNPPAATQEAHGSLMFQCGWPSKVHSGPLFQSIFLRMFR